MSLPEFKDEAEFRQKWIAPFLAKLGYTQIRHTHGAGEQGKDFFFAEPDKFGHLRFHAVQVKRGKIGAGEHELQNLYNQVDRCFKVTIKDHKNADRQRISSVYIMTDGTISDKAREYITEHFRLERYGENVFLLDGETLDNLERHATFIDDKALENRLLALRKEARYNLKIISHLYKTTLEGEPKFLPCMIMAVEDALCNPLPERIISFESIATIWSRLKLIQDFYAPYTLDADQDKLDNIHALSEQTIPEIENVIKKLDKAIDELRSQYSLDIEIEYPIEPAMQESKEE